MPWYDCLNIGLLTVIWMMLIRRMGLLYATNKWWVLYFGVYTVTELAGLPFSIMGINNLWIYNISKPVQFILILRYVCTLSSIKGIKLRTIMICACILCVVFAGLKKFDHYDSLEDTIYSSIIIALSVIYFYRVIVQNEYIDINSSGFWFCSGIFIFYGINFCVTGALGFLLENQRETAKKLFYVIVFNSFIFYTSVLHALLSVAKDTLKTKEW